MRNKNTLTIDIALKIDSDLWGNNNKEWENFFKPAANETLNRFDWETSVEISIVLTNDSAIQKLNREYRGKDNPTNVLSFPSFDDEEENHLFDKHHPVLLGDLVFSFETIQKEAVDSKKSFSDHLTHLCVHGLLHLLGFDHETDKEAEEMEALEVEILSKLNIFNPYILK